MNVLKLDNNAPVKTSDSSQTASAPIPDRRRETDLMELELERLRAENAALKKKGSKPITCKVGAKGGVSVYGLGRFPVTLYASQWERLLQHRDQIISFMAEHVGQLNFKED